MSRIPTEAEIDAMSDAELEAYLATARPGAPTWTGPAGTDSSRAGQAADGGDIAASTSSRGWMALLGASRAYGWLLVVCAAVGIAAAWVLIRAEITIIREPLAQLTCDINPLVSCGASLDTWQGNLLGVPNAFVGVMAFSVLLCLGVLVVSGVRLPRWTWMAMSLACLGAAGFIGWFLTQSIVSFGRLCPWCMVIWAVTIPVVCATWGEAAGNGALGLSADAGARVWRVRWWLCALAYLAVVVTVLVAFWDGWVSLLR